METQCAICFSDVDESKKASIKTCKHEFCFVCISEWIKTKTVCPLCNVEVQVLVVEVDGKIKEEKIEREINKLKESTLEQDLTCLDHTYFLDEVERLLQVAHLCSQQLTMRSMKSKRGGVLEHRGMRSIQSAIEELSDYQQLFHSFEQFDPFSALQALYRIQDQVRIVQSGDFHKLEEWDGEEKVQKRYGADDVPEEWSEDEDEDYYHDQHVQKKSPPSRKSQKEVLVQSEFGRKTVRKVNGPQNTSLTRGPTASPPTSVATSTLTTFPVTTTSSSTVATTMTTAARTQDSAPTPLASVDTLNSLDAVLGDSLVQLNLQAPDEQVASQNSPSLPKAKGKGKGKGKDRRGKDFTFEPLFYENNKNKNNKQVFHKSKSENYQRSK